MADSQFREEDADRLAAIQTELRALTEEARTILKKDGHRSLVYQRADGYWLAHMEGAIAKESRYVGGSMFTLEDSIEEVRNIADGRDSDEEDEEEIE